MHNRKGKSRFKNFRILLSSGYISMIVMGRLIKKLCPEKDSPMQWNTQAVNITTNIKIKIYEESNMCFSYSTPREISQVLKHI